MTDAQTRAKVWLQKSATDVWLTPKWILDDLGPFDFDPCAATVRPWPTAKAGYIEEDDGLAHPWDGFVWLNPPFSKAGAWMRRMAEHGNGIAIVAARVETIWFREFVWRSASAVLFLARRVAYCDEQGKEAPATMPVAQVLCAYGVEAALRLCNSRIDGTLISEWRR